MKTILFRYGKTAFATAMAVGLLVASSPLAQSEEETAPELPSVENIDGSQFAEELTAPPVTAEVASTGENASPETAGVPAAPVPPAPAAAPAADAQNRSVAAGPKADFKFKTVKAKDGVATVKVTGKITDDTGLSKPMESLMLHKRGNKAEVSAVVSATYDGKEAAGEVFDFQPKELKDTFGLSDEDAQFPQILRISLDPGQFSDGNESLIGKKFSATYKVPVDDKGTQWELLPNDSAFLPEFQVGGSNNIMAAHARVDKKANSTLAQPPKFHFTPQTISGTPSTTNNFYKDHLFGEDTSKESFKEYFDLENDYQPFEIDRPRINQPQGNPLFEPQPEYLREERLITTGYPAYGWCLKTYNAPLDYNNHKYGYKDGNNGAHECPDSRYNEQGRFFSREHISRRIKENVIEGNPRYLWQEDFTLGGNDGGIWSGGVLESWGNFKDEVIPEADPSKYHVAFQVDGILDTSNWTVTNIGADTDSPVRYLLSPGKPLKKGRNQWCTSKTPDPSNPGQSKCNHPYGNFDYSYAQVDFAVAVSLDRNKLWRYDFLKRAGIEKWVNRKNVGYVKDSNLLRFGNPWDESNTRYRREDLDRTRWALKIPPNTPARLSWYMKHKFPADTTLKFLGFEPKWAYTGKIEPSGPKPPTITKTLSEPQPADSNVIGYDITVSDPDSPNDVLKVTDDIKFPEGVEIEEVTLGGGPGVYSPPTNVNTSPYHDYKGHYVNGKKNEYTFEIPGIPGRTATTYNVFVKVKPIAQNIGNLVCGSSYSAGHGGYNEATVTVPDKPQIKGSTAVACRNLTPAGMPSISKKKVSISGPSNERAYQATYDVTVNNTVSNSQARELDVFDKPKFSPNTHIKSISVQDFDDSTGHLIGTRREIWNDNNAVPPNGYKLVDSGWSSSPKWSVRQNTVAKKRVTVKFTYNTRNIVPGVDSCQSSSASYGAFNQVDMSLGGEDLGSANTCLDITPPVPEKPIPEEPSIPMRHDRGLDKDFVSAEKIGDGDNAKLKVKYTIDIVDPSMHKAGTILETPKFGFPLENASAEVTVVYYSLANKQGKFQEKHFRFNSVSDKFSIPIVFSQVFVHVDVTLTTKYPGRINKPKCGNPGSALFNEVKYQPVSSPALITQACGDYPQPPGPPPIRVKLKKLDSSGDLITFDQGYAFKLYKVENGVLIKENPINFSQESNNENLISDSELEEGDYALIETQAPAGYELLPKPILVRVSQRYDGNLHLSIPNEDDSLAVFIEGDKNIIDVVDVHSGDLPRAGGIGVFWMLGVGLVMLAGSWFLNRRYQN